MDGLWLDLWYLDLEIRFLDYCTFASSCMDRLNCLKKNFALLPNPKLYVMVDIVTGATI